MRCSEAADQLQLYLDGRLPAERRRALEDHLQRCSACRREWQLLAEMVRGLESLEMVTEPEDLTARIMERVAVTARHEPQSLFALLRLSPSELLAAAALATIASLGSLLQQPALRQLLPLESGPLLFLLTYLSHLLATVDASTLMLALWIIGTLVGVCVTLIAAGEEMRSRWLRAVWERLPVLH